MRKIITIDKCGNCPDAEYYNGWFHCPALNDKHVFSNTLDPDCPLEDYQDTCPLRNKGQVQESFI